MTTIAGGTRRDAPIRGAHAPLAIYAPEKPAVASQALCEQDLILLQRIFADELSLIALGPGAGDDHHAPVGALNPDAFRVFDEQP